MSVTTTEKPTTKAAGEQSLNGQTRDKTSNLHQRIVAITGEVKVKATGTTGRQAGDKRTISIGDVDEALAPLMAKHGVVSDYDFNDKPEAFDSPTRDGVMKMWLVNITGIIANADNPEADRLTRKLYDIGSNPSAAVSFALKRWQRALFKLVEDDDQQEDRSPAVGRATGNGHAAPAASSLTEEQALEIGALNNSLPRPYSEVVLAAMAKSGFTAAGNALRTAHRDQCKGGCTHIAKA